MATITKNGYTYDTEAKTRTSPTGKVVSVENMDAITPNLKADTPMSLNSLNQTNQLNLPEKTPEVSPTYTLTPLETFERETQTRADTSDKNYLDTQKAIGEAEARELTYQEELGASENLKAFKDYERQLQAEQLALRRYKEDIAEQTTGSKEMTNELIRQEEAKSLRKQADIAILGNAALGKYNEAMQVAKSKVEMELKPLTRQLDYYKSVMDRNQDLLTKSQTAKLQSLYADVEREKNKEEERLTKGNEMIINALSFNAPANSIEKAKSILEKGGTIIEMATALGKYSGDYLTNEIKIASLTKTNEEINKIRKEIKASENIIDTSTLPNTTNGVALKLMASAKNDKQLDATERQQLTKARSVINQLDALQSNIQKQNKTGLFKGKVGILLEKFGLDADVGVINAQLQAITPNLARGVYGEVGVLTDSDIRLYRTTLPRLDRPEDQNSAIMALTLKTVAKSIENTLTSAVNSGIDVSGWTQDYVNITKQIYDIEDRIGISKEAVNTFVGQNTSFAPVIKEMYQKGLTDGEILEALNLR